MSLNPEHPTSHTEITEQRQRYRQQASDAIAFANVIMKWQYDTRHKPIKFQPDDFVYLGLYKGYSLADKGQTKASRKLGIQRVGPFRIRSKVGRNAYELATGNEVGELPPHWRIHSVISVEQLEPGVDP